VLSHVSAAELFGLVDAPDGTPESPVHVSVPLPGGRVRTGIRLHRVRRLDPDERTLREGIPVTAPLRTIVDLAPGAHPRQLERAIAHAEREGLVATGDLDTIATRYRGRPAAGLLRQVIDQAGGPRLTRSEAERRFLELVRRARLPMPRSNVPVAGYEIDFLWPEHGLAVEVDGYRFHGSRARFENDRRRSAQLASLGIQVIPLTWRQIVHDEVATAVQIGRALLRPAAQ
jgi:very-short-patch-repair endonuclease